MIAVCIVNRRNHDTSTEPSHTRGTRCVVFSVKEKIAVIAVRIVNPGRQDRYKIQICLRIALPIELSPVVAGGAGLEPATDSSLVDVV